ncbi:rhamnogalacturonan endolyase family protein [Paractinoplanes durhamensis]|uniref:rhamnogalacturonan endolyase family protein n=1 Tax=Paractinoplanes durhamensis TaxID=113563 RepID=UPI0036253F6E
MRLRRIALVAALLLAGSQAPAQAGGRRGIELERLDRGLVAAATSEGVFLSWRLLGPEATGHSTTGLTSAAFQVYRDGRRIATVTDSTNYLDRAGTATSKYQVAPVHGAAARPPPRGLPTMSTCR